MFIRTKQALKKTWISFGCATAHHVLASQK